MNRINWFKGLLFLLIITACDEKNSTISGVIEGADEVYISEINVDGQKVLDTVQLNDGKFEYELQVDTPNFYHLGTSKRVTIAVYLNPGDDIKIKAGGTEKILTYEVEGNEESVRIQKIYSIIQEGMEYTDSLDQVAQTHQAEGTLGQVENELRTSYHNKIAESRQKAKDLIDSDPGNITNIFIFPLSIGQFPLIPAEQDFSYFEKASEAINNQNPDNPHAKSFAERVAKYRNAMNQQKELEKVQRNVVPGAMAPEISLADPEGKIRNLSDLRGKVVLVDFWAAWCRPCRMANPGLVKLYHKYKDQGFEIFSVSLDGLPQQRNGREEWLGAIEQDGLIWENHVSDLKGWDSEVVKSYGFQGIPYTVLVNYDGKIIATNLHGPGMEEQLKRNLAALPKN